MRLQLLYIIDKEPFEDIVRTAEDLFSQKDADLCIVCNSTNDDVLRYLDGNRDKIKSYRYFCYSPENYLRLFELSLVAHSKFNGYVFIVPGTSLPKSFSETCLKTLIEQPNETRIIFSSDKSDKEIFFRNMLISNQISCANVCIKTRSIIPVPASKACLYAKPWGDTILNLLHNYVLVSDNIPIYSLPKVESSFFYFLGQFNFLIDIHKMPFYQNLEWAKPMKRHVLDALHAHGRYAADFAVSVKEKDYSIYSKINRLSKIMLRQKEIS
jgi:hypothetical protein